VTKQHLLHFFCSAKSTI